MNAVWDVLCTESIFKAIPSTWLCALFALTFLKLPPDDGSPAQPIGGMIHSLHQSIKYIEKFILINQATASERLAPPKKVGGFSFASYYDALAACTELEYQHTVVVSPEIHPFDLQSAQVWPQLAAATLLVSNSIVD